MKLSTLLPRTTRTLLAGVLLAGGISSTAKAAFVITGGVETSVGTFYNPNFVDGYSFVSTIDQSLTALGFWDSGANGLGGPAEVGLWDTVTQTLLATATIDNADALELSVTIAGGNYRYETLGAAVSLTGGTSYTLGWLHTAAFQNSTDSLLIDAGLTTDASVSIVTSSRFLSSGTLVFPATITGDPRVYGQVNAQLSAIPEPTTALFGAALLGVVGLSRRRAASRAKA